jgi:segregation and condensation protein B
VNEIEHTIEPSQAEETPVESTKVDGPAIETAASAEDNLEQSSLPLAEGLRLDAKIEAVIFASQKPVKTMEIFELVKNPVVAPDDGGDGEENSSETESFFAELEKAPEVTLKDVQECLTQLTEYYRDRAGGFTLRYTKGLGYQFQTVPAAAPVLERQFAQRPRPISRAALETLAIIAYRQPVTRAEVEYIRGVDAGSIIKNLLERDLIACTGRKEIAGRPMVFGTTAEFLKVFQLSSPKDLPPLESFQPSHEALTKALEKLEQGEQQVDVEGFIGDEASGENPDPEMALPVGDMLPPGSGEVDL